MKRATGRSRKPRAATRGRERAPCALAIGGLDPSGGAGITADMRAFSAAGAWGCGVCAMLTVQSTAGLRSAHPMPALLVTAQAREALEYEHVLAIKTGALGSSANALAAAAVAREHPRLPLVVDPVMIATRARHGARLLDDDALDALRALCRGATLVTPNIDEAEALLASRVRDVADAREAATQLASRSGGAVLVKGGHLKGDRVIDVLATRSGLVELSSVRDMGPPFHGGGCTLASLIAGRLAANAIAPRDEAGLIEAVRWSRRRLARAIARASRIGEGLRVLAP